MSFKKKYSEIAKNCCITTASCDKFFLRVINLVYSIKKNFIEHPNIYVYNLGMHKSQIRELSKIKGVIVRDVPAFFTHWRIDYSWKLFIYNDERPEKFLFHIDAGSIVLRPLYLIFLSIVKNNVFLIGQQQVLSDIAPHDYFDMLEIDIDKYGKNEIFTAGVIGFNLNSLPIKKILNEAFLLASHGYCLGYSQIEAYRDVYMMGIIRDCPRFRHDQTIINLLINKYLCNLYIHNEKKYIGIGGVSDHPRQYIWNSRLNNRALKYVLYFKLNSLPSFMINRIIFIFGMLSRRLKKWTQKK